jgi:hypothetical protein
MTTRNNIADVIKAGYGPELATSRHVLMTIMLFMDESGCAFPSTKRIASASGLSERAVINHIQKLMCNSWLTRSSAGLNGQGWKRHKYNASLPAGEYCIRRNGANEVIVVEGTDSESVPSKKEALNQSQCVCRKGTDPGAKGADPDDMKALKEGQSKSSYNSTSKIYDTQDLETAAWMWKYIDGLAPGQKKPNLTKWAGTIRLMREMDKRTTDDIKAVFTWAHQDHFWRTNIRSPEKLRDKFDDLNVKRLTPKAPGSGEQPAVMAQSHKLFKPELAKKSDKAMAMKHIGGLTNLGRSKQ